LYQQSSTVNTLCSHLKEFLSRNLDQNKFKNALFFGKAVTVFSAQALRKQQQHNLQSFKNTFLSNHLDQNINKNALFFEKKLENCCSVGGSAPNPRWPPAAGGSIPRPPSCCSNFSAS